MNILITGGTGFLGKNLAEMLRKKGHHVAILGRDKKKCFLLEEKGFEVIKGDLIDPDRIALAIKNRDIVVHAAALSSAWGKYHDFYSANVTGTKNVISACFNNNVNKLIFISSSSVYFDYSDRRNIKEYDPLPKKPVNHYAATKLLAEKSVTSAQKKGLNTVILRPRGIFGPGDTAIFPRILKAVEKRSLPLFDEGNKLLDITYVDNVSAAIINAIETSGDISGQIFNITNNEPMYLIDILSLLFSHLELDIKFHNANFKRIKPVIRAIEYLYNMPFVKKEPRFTCYSLGLLAFDQTLCIESAKKYLGYNPKISIEDGIHRFVDSINQEEF